MQTAGDYRYFGALGQPSYWSGKKNKDDLQSDNGASRWEMVTRNQGKEFVRDRLLPLSQIVAARSVDEVRDGLLGLRIEDEAGKNEATSRTATGLHAPSKTDNARAWCALIGVSAFPTRISTDGSHASTAGQLQNIVPSFVAVRSQNSVSNTLERSMRNRGWQVPQLTGLTKKVFWHVAFLTSLCRIIRVLRNDGWNLAKSFR